MDASVQHIGAGLLGWYKVHARALPWRARPGDLPTDPYRVWLSEVMLQQTTVAAVIPYFEKFTRRWPDLFALAAAEDGDVMAAWAGLGYYARARNLLACARAVAALGGRFPASEQGLRKLPGLGAYTAAAIAAIAYGQRAVVVDANVERVIARLFAIDTPLPAGRAAIRAATDRLTPERGAGDFAQAMMDLGSAVCTARNPRCAICPISGDCAGLRLGDPARFPVKPPKKPKPQRTGNAYWIEQAGAVWLVRRPAKGMLGGMLALPDDGWTARADGNGTAPLPGGNGIPPLPGSWSPRGVVSHGFTHFDLALAVQLYFGNKQVEVSGEMGQWWPIARLEMAGLPSLFAKAAQLILAHRGEK